MQNETVSIIIPIYNVEDYLRRCLESVVRQSYSAIEVLLIDDGSTDRSGMICEQWAKQDVRFRVVHTENGGISQARNTGLSIATGKYVSFIDSDDFVAEDMLEKLYVALTENNADISICNFYRVDEYGNLIFDNDQYLPIKTEVISGVDAITYMQFGKGGGCYDLPWNKLYKRSLFSDVQFPLGKYCEDGFISHRLLGKCSRIACIQDVCYYYMQRNGSIMHSDNPLVYLHQAEARLDRMNYLYNLGLNRCAGKAYWKAAMFLANTCQYGGQSETIKLEFQEVLMSLRKNSWLREYCTLKEKIQSWLVCFSPVLYCHIFKNAVRQHIKSFFHRVFDKDF